MNAFMNPSTSVLAKLASIVVHVEEMTSDNGHEVDRIALETLLSDPEVQTFIRAGRTLAMVPEKR